MNRSVLSNRLASFFVVAGAALSASACQAHLGESTSGEAGAVEFEYTGWSCLFGCAMDTPLLVGTKQRISITGSGSDDDGVVAKSTNEAVATFAVERHCDCEQSNGTSTTIMSPTDGACEAGFRRTCDNSVTVNTLTPGEAGLELRTARGILVDRTMVVVDRARSVTLHDGDGNEIGPTLSLREGDGLLVSAHLLDTSGERMLADEGVRWDVSGTAASSGFCLLCTSDETSLQADEPGKATVTMTAPGVRSSFVVSVER